MLAFCFQFYDFNEDKLNKWNNGQKKQMNKQTKNTLTGCSVAPQIKPNRKPNTKETNIPVHKVINPVFWNCYDFYYCVPINKQAKCEPRKILMTPKGEEWIELKVKEKIPKTIN